MLLRYVVVDNASTEEQAIFDRSYTYWDRISISTLFLWEKIFDRHRIAYRSRYSYKQVGLQHCLASRTYNNAVTAGSSIEVH